MNAERIRTILGVWAPMGIGLFIIVTSVHFYFTAALTGGLLEKNLESWRLVCSAGAFFVGGVMILSTYGRYTKAREARRDRSSGKPPAGPPDATALQAPSDPAPERDEPS